jgi:hypothetical protein
VPWLEKKGMVRGGHGRGMASVNQTRTDCVNQMGKTHSKPLAARHGRGMLCVNWPLVTLLFVAPQGNWQVGWKDSVLAQGA